MKLKEIVLEFISGDWGAEAKSLKNPCKIRCIRGADFQPLQTNGKLDSAPIRYVAGNSLSSRKLKKGDIVIEKSGGSPTQSTGRALYVSDAMIEGGGDIMCSNFCVAIRVNSNWNSKYFYYFWTYLYSLGVFFNFEGKTSGIKNLQLDSVLSSIEFPSVSLEQQKKVVSILNGIEEKILLNRKINRNLEALVRHLYDYWFVQFDFPDENGRPYKSSGGKIAKNEVLGREIPVHWTHTTIERYADIHNGATPPTSVQSNYGGDVIWITPKDLSDQSQKFTFKGERAITTAGYNSCSTTLLPKGTVLMSSRAPIGLLSIAATELCTNQGFKNLVPKNNKEQRFLYYLVCQHLPIIKQMGGGTTFHEISRDQLSKLRVPNVPSQIIEYWDLKVKPIFDKQELLLREIDVLTQQRDELLPLLMNGQVSIISSEINCDLSQDL